MRLTSREFSSHLHEIFLIHTDDSGAIDAELIEVSGFHDPLRNEEDREGPRGFSLVFRVPLQARLPQGIYELEHKTMGSMDIFLVPIKPDQKGGRMEAVFSMGSIQIGDETAARCSEMSDCSPHSK